MSSPRDWSEAPQSCIWTAIIATVVLDADTGVLDESIGDLIRLVDVVIASRGFATGFVAREGPAVAVAALHALGPETAIVTLGDAGCVGICPEGPFANPAFAVDAVDTTGAGDVFHGAFLIGMLRRWPQAQIVEFAAAVAAIKCTRLGGRAGIPTFGESVDFLKARGAANF